MIKINELNEKDLRQKKIVITLLMMMAILFLIPTIVNAATCPDCGAAMDDSRYYWISETRHAKRCLNYERGTCTYYSSRPFHEFSACPICGTANMYCAGCLWTVDHTCIAPDTTPPTYSNFTSTGGAYTNDPNFSFTVSVAVADTGGSGIGEVNFNAFRYRESTINYYTNKKGVYNSSTGKYEATFTLAEIKDSVTGATNLGEGPYYVDGSVGDNAGNYTWLGAYSVTLDTTAPTWSNFSPTGTIYTNNSNYSFTISLNASDTSGISSVSINAWHGGSWVSTNSSKTATYNSSTGKYEATYTLSEIKNTSSGATNNGDGTYSFDAWINDSAGNSVNAGWGNIVLDTAAPTIRSHDNIQYTTNPSGTMRVSLYGVTDNISGVNRVEWWLYKDGVLQWEGQSGANDGTTYYKDITLSGEGTYTIHGIAYDNAGNAYNWSSDHGMNIVADGTAPTVSGIGSSGYTNNVNQSVTLWATSSDALSGIQRIQFNAWTGGGWTTYSSVKNGTYNSSTGRYEVTFSLNEIQHTVSGATNNGEGTYLFDVYTYDNAGNYTYGGQIRWVCDTTAPTFSVSASKYYYNASDSKAIINVNNIVDTGGSGLSHLYYFYNELTAENTWTRGEIQNIGSSATIELSLKTEQGHEIAIKVVDKAGNVSYNSADAEGYIRANYVYDKTAPSATGLTLSTTYTNTGTLRATAQGVSDNLSGVSAVKWYVRKSDWSTGILDQASTGQWYYDIDVTSLGEGTYIVGMVIYDNAGNLIDTTSTIGWKTFYYDKTAPTIEQVPAMQVYNQAGKTVTFSIKVSDNISGISIGSTTWHIYAGDTLWSTSGAEGVSYDANTHMLSKTVTLPNGSDGWSGNCIFNARPVIYDNAGNYIDIRNDTSKQMQIMIDTTPPTVGSFQGTQYTNNINGTVRVHMYDVLDNLSGVDYAFVWLYKDNEVVWMNRNMQVDGTTYYMDIELSGEGTYWLDGGVYDKAGNSYSWWGEMKIVADATPPVATGVGDWGNTNDPNKSVTIWAQVTDSLSEISYVQVNALTGGSWTTYCTTKNAAYNSTANRYEVTYSLNEIVHTVSGATSNGEATYMFDIYASDNAGNSTYCGHVRWTCDMTAPTDATITINSGAKYTNTSNVTLTLNAADTLSGMSQMAISNTETIGTFETYATSKSWTLSTGDGEKTVYVIYKDNAGNMTAVFE